MASSYVYIFAVVLLTFVLILEPVSSERMKSKIYDSIEGSAACFRRLNGTHQFGCTSHRLGNVGVVHFIETNEDLIWLLQEGEAVPYIAVLYPANFTRDVLLKLKNSRKVNGIALLNSGTPPDYFTHEDTCPNRYSGLSVNETCDAKGQGAWNPHGTKLLLEDWGFPIFYVIKDVEKILNCYTKFNSDGRNKLHDRSLCALELSSFMFATVDSATCIRRSKMITNLNPMRFCDPLGSRNVWSTLFPRNKTSHELVYVVAARMDTSSLFDGITPGAVSPVTGIVTLLSTAHILSKMFSRSDTNTEHQINKNILFVLFNGEAYDYIGSSRMVWDMQKGRFPGEEDEAVPEQPSPLRLNHLEYFIELSHLTNQFRTDNGSQPNLFFHSSPKKNSVQSQVSTNSFIEEMKKVGSKFGLQFNESGFGRLPPASLQTFVAENNSLPGVIIADFNSSFTTRYYNSIFDNSETLHYHYQNGSSEQQADSIQTFVGNLSTALAHTLYKMLTGYKGNETFKADLQIVDELFHCYLEKMNCSLFQNASYNIMLNDEPANLYIGVNSWRAPNYLITTITGQVLAYLTGDIVNKTAKECHNNPLQQIYQYIWMKGNGDSGACVKTTMNYSAAVSPAFEEPGYDWSSGHYSTWTESVWQELGMRLFLKPSRAHDVKIFSIGAVVLGLSFIIVYFLNARSHILFGNTLGTGAC